MRVLFLHMNYPAQYRHVALAMGKNPNHQILFGTNNKDVTMEGIPKTLFGASREVRPETHHYVRPLESAVLNGQGAYRMAEQLKAKGFIPDVICGHSGWGPTLFMKDAFPNAALLCYFEWFYHAHGTDADFDPADPLEQDSIAKIRVKNSPILLDLYSCDWGMSPTRWQQAQFPKEFQSKLTVLHDGVDTDFFKPELGASLVLPNLDLTGVDEIVTYVARGMEPYRGFPQFIESLPYLLERRPNCHVVIVASERVCYGKSLPNGKTYKQEMLERVPLDAYKDRVHFVGTLPYGEYVKVLKASTAHVYLTRPFVLSWSMLEAMSTGCLIVGSNTAPVAEVIRDGENGLLVDFFNPKQLADRLEEVMTHPNRMAHLRKQARQTILDQYALVDLLPKHLQLIEDVANRSMARWQTQQLPFCSR
jgi:glycosyltransferase involved in cell wall biosynthesis